MENQADNNDAEQEAVNQEEVNINNDG